VADILGCSEGFVGGKTARLDEVVCSCEVKLCRSRLWSCSGEEAVDGDVVGVGVGDGGGE
jgi:hypothetical protein